MERLDRARSGRNRFGNVRRRLHGPPLGRVSGGRTCGNIIYLAIEPQLPTPLRHRMFQIDLGLALDFLICVALYGLIRLARGSGQRGASALELRRSLCGGAIPG